jgi:hypothetical protein
MKEGIISNLFLYVFTIYSYHKTHDLVKKSFFLHKKKSYSKDLFEFDIFLNLCK